MTEKIGDPSSIVSIQDLHVHFSVSHRRAIIKAVDGVSFEVESGKTFGIIGESGSGKSTIGRALIGLLRPTSGTVLHEGRDPFRLSRREFAVHRRNYVTVFQDPDSALDPRMNIAQSVREPLDIDGQMRPSQRDERVMHLLEIVGLNPDHSRRYPHELSGGQKQRVNIARALALNPKLIVCDEVVAALDVSIQADILNLFSELQRKFNLTYVFISHDLGVVAHISDRIGVMYLGKLVELGPSDLLMRSPRHPYTQALLSAEPCPLPSRLRTKKRIMLQGEIPSPIDPPVGCRFNTRCWMAQEICRTDPRLHEVAQDQHAACHFVDVPQPTSGSIMPTGISALAHHA